MLGGIDAGFAPTQQRIHPRQQFREREGFYEIIVGAAFEAVDAVADRGQRGEDQDRRFDVRRAQRPEHRQAVDHRQHAVENDEVEAAVGRAEQAVLAIGRLLDAMALLGQALGEIGRGFAIILDQQNLAAHKPSVRRPS